jgi:hypothetical protein
MARKIQDRARGIKTQAPHVASDLGPDLWSG